MAEDFSAADTAHGQRATETWAWLHRQQVQVYLRKIEKAGNWWKSPACKPCQAAKGAVVRTFGSWKYGTWTFEGKDSWRLKLIDHPSAPSIGTGVACDLTAFAVVQATADMLVELRHHPGPIQEKLLPASLLKHADEQTVAGLVAVLRAQQQPALAGLSFQNWGVVGASRFLGRTALAAAMQRFAEEGAWGISPHLIPHRSLHSLSGTISQVLKIHGPNFGVGGGPHGEEDALLAAAALLSDQQMPGVWVVLTGWDPEPTPDKDGNATQAHCVCHGLALALVSARSGTGALRLRFVPQSKLDAAGPLAGSVESFNMFRLPALLESLTRALTPASVVWQLASGGWMELAYRGTVAGDCSLNMVQPSAQKGWLEQSLFETSAEKKS